VPHCELHYSDDLNLDAAGILQLVEAVINAHDPNAHECKGRAYPTSIFHRTHLKVTVSLLTKEHRDEQFTQRLMADLEAKIKSELAQSCHFSLLVEYNSAYYMTNEHLVPGDDLPMYSDS